MSHVLYDSQYWFDQDVDDYVEDYLECHGKERSDFADEQELRRRVRSWIDGFAESDWNDFKAQCDSEKGHLCLVTGYFMAWNGKREGGKLYDSLSQAVADMPMDGDSHPVFSLTDEGLLVLDETHHDAPVDGNHYEFRMLTDAGESYYAKHKNDPGRLLCKALQAKGRSRNVNPSAFGI